MDIKKLLDECNSTSFRLYEQRQNLQMQLQQVQATIQNIELEMVKFDGKIEVLNSILEEQKKLEAEKEAKKKEGERLLHGE